MSEAQPPAGWYTDPQDATQQRYWDGNAWTGHTAPGGAAQNTPTGDASTGAALPTGAPTWQVPAGGAPVSAKPSWYKRPWIMVPLIIFIVLVVVGAIVGSGTGNAANAMEKAIKTDGQKQLQTEVDQNVPNATVTVDKVNCVKDGDTQNYGCLVNFTVTAGTETAHFFQHVAGECDDHGHCLWHTTEQPQETSGSGSSS